MKGKLIRTKSGRQWFARMLIDRMMTTGILAELKNATDRKMSDTVYYTVTSRESYHMGLIMNNHNHVLPIGEHNRHGTWKWLTIFVLSRRLLHIDDWKSYLLFAREYLFVSIRAERFKKDRPANSNTTSAYFAHLEWSCFRFRYSPPFLVIPFWAQIRYGRTWLAWEDLGK